MFGNWWKPNRVLETRKSKYNGIITVKKSWGLGTYLEVGGLTQSGWVLEAIWNKMLRQIRSTKFEVRNVLILGLGGGSVIKPLKKYWPKAKITGVDIDPMMIQLGKKYLGLDKFKIKTVITDAAIYNIQNTICDLIIVDLYNGKNFPQQFESEKFIKKLSSNKLVIINRVWNKKDDGLLIVDFRKKLKKCFNKVDIFYPVANVMFTCQSTNC